MQIGGKAFQVVDLDRRTVRHDARIRAVLSRVGVLRAVRETGTSDEQLAEALSRVIVEQEASAEIAALFLLPHGIGTWTPDVHTDVLAHLNGCTTEGDRVFVDQFAFDMVCGFFQLRLRWLDSILISLSLPPQPDDVKSAA